MSWKGEISLLLMVCLLTSSKLLAQPCSSEQNGQIFLWNMTSVINTPEGLVFVCDNGLWRRICDDMWTDEDAIVACRELGFSDKGATATFKSANSDLPDFTSTVPRCNGTETRLSDCPQTPALIGNCSSGGAAVVCLLHPMSQGPSCTCTHSEEVMSPLLAGMIGATSTLVVILVIGTVMAIVARAQLAVQDRKERGRDSGEKPEDGTESDMQVTSRIDTELIVRNQAYMTSLRVIPTTGNQAYMEVDPVQSHTLVQSRPTQVQVQPLPSTQEGPVAPQSEQVYDVCL